MKSQPRSGLARRLIASHGLVIAAGASTLAGVAILTGPSLFRSHVRQALGPLSQDASGHLDAAFASALLLSIGLAVLVSAAAAFGLSWYMARRIAQPVSRLAGAAERIAGGSVHTRVPVPSPDDELADVSRSFNRMAAALEETETTRQQLLSDLAHELRTPMATLEGYVEGLEDGVVPPDAATWATLGDALTRLRRLVDDLGAVSRAEELADLKLQPVAPSVLASSAVAAAQPIAQQRGARLRADAGPDAPEVLVDVERLGEALHNLIHNAVRHTPPGGQVTVAVDADKSWVELIVQDDGEGIAGQDLSHLFQRFYRADPARGEHGGSGIGLTIVAAIVQTHHGTVHAESDGPGTGSRFVIRLPAAHAAYAAGLR